MLQDQLQSLLEIEKKHLFCFQSNQLDTLRDLISSTVTTNICQFDRNGSKQAWIFCEKVNIVFRYAQSSK